MKPGLVVKRLCYATPLMACSLATMWLGALVVATGLHGMWASGLILSRLD